MYSNLTCVGCFDNGKFDFIERGMEKRMEKGDHVKRASRLAQERPWCETEVLITTGRYYHAHISICTSLDSLESGADIIVI